MRSLNILVTALCLVTGKPSVLAGTHQKMDIMESKENAEEILKFARTIQWLGQATVKFSYQGHVIYIDPYQLKNRDHANLIVITHDHGDHFSLPDIAMIADTDTRFIVAEACADKLKQAGYQNVQTVRPGSTIHELGLLIEAVSAYNVTRQMHPRSRNYVGYVIDFGGIKVYHTGDTERIPEMKAIRCDIILLPLGQTYTMTSVEEAVEAVGDTKASVAIPIHWGLYEGSKADEEKFKELLRKRNVTVLTGK